MERLLAAAAAAWAFVVMLEGALGLGAFARVVFICCQGPEPWYLVLIPIEVAALCYAAAKSELWNRFELFLV